jgi:hypothetical protein
LARLAYGVVQCPDIAMIAISLSVLPWKSSSSIFCATTDGVEPGLVVGLDHLGHTIIATKVCATRSTMKSGIRPALG